MTHPNCFKFWGNMKQYFTIIVAISIAFPKWSIGQSLWNSSLSSWFLGDAQGTFWCPLPQHSSRTTALLSYQALSKGQWPPAVLSPNLYLACTCHVATSWSKILIEQQRNESKERNQKAYVINTGTQSLPYSFWKEEEQELKYND